MAMKKREFYKMLEFKRGHTCGGLLAILPLETVQLLQLAGRKAGIEVEVDQGVAVKGYAGLRLRRDLLDNRVVDQLFPHYVALLNEGTPQTDRQGGSRRG